MKRITASEARRDWFRLLDEITTGEEVCIERKGCRILLRREREYTPADHPDYSEVLRVRDADSADTWGWDWDEAGIQPDQNPVRRK